MNGLQGKIAIITGGSRGLGRAAAKRLGAEGVQVGILDIRDAEPVCQEIRAEGGSAESWICDTSNEQQLSDIFRDFDGHFERIDVLVNNAGILSPRIPWYQWDPKEVERFIRKYSSNPSPNNEQRHTPSSLRRAYEWAKCSGNA